MKNLYIAMTLLASVTAWPQSGGEDFLLEGNNSFNLGENECESNDPAFPNLRFTISGVQQGILISDGSGEYALPLAQGIHVLTPELENPEYFEVSPPEVTLNFPDDATPAVRNFCVNPNGVHPDMEVVLVPMGDAVPGQAISYRLVYRNKGNQLLSGSVSVTYDAQALSFAGSDPDPEDQSPGYLSFNFTEVNPFRANHVLLNFTVNSGDPGVEPGDPLAFAATVSLAQDVFPADNVHYLNDVAEATAGALQMICVQGENVGTSAIGNFVHYLVRFENTTDQPIQNLLISSELDPGEFDISSVVIIKGSHDFHSRIIGNMLYFYLDNIGLPNIGIENQGYILYRVRTSQGLSAGDSFSNMATVQFDQSPPFDTNTFTTTIQALSVPDITTKLDFALYPNPAGDQVVLRVPPGISAKSLTLFNMLGQRISNYLTSGAETVVDVSKLARGTYLIKVHSEGDPAILRFIKK